MTKTITHATVERALDHVVGELSDTGLLTRRLFAVPVFVQRFDVGPFVLSYEGLYVEDTSAFDRLCGFEARTIYVPLTSTSRLLGALRGTSPSSLRDILRHELGHAFAVEHPQLVRRSAAFRSAFGARYDDANEQDEDDCITAYAATNAAEDFAETLMTYVRVRGQIAPFKGRKAVHRKLRFVQALAAQVERRDLA